MFSQCGTLYVREWRHDGVPHSFWKEERMLGKKLAEPCHGRLVLRLMAGLLKCTQYSEVSWRSWSDHHQITTPAFPASHGRTTAPSRSVVDAHAVSQILPITLKIIGPISMIWKAPRTVARPERGSAGGPHCATTDRDPCSHLTPPFVLHGQTMHSCLNLGKPCLFGEL